MLWADAVAAELCKGCQTTVSGFVGPMKGFLAAAAPAWLWEVLAEALYRHATAARAGADPQRDSPEEAVVCAVLQALSHQTIGVKAIVAAVLDGLLTANPATG